MEEYLAILEKRGVRLEDIIDCVRFLHSKYDANIKDDEIIDNISRVLSKREVQNALLTAVELDTLCEEGKFHSKKLESILMNDEGLYGIDEVLAYGICNIYGSIALTNFGYIDKIKPGIIGKLNETHEGVCNTFLDDIVGAIAASVASRLAHGK